jgi:hypothetical protein
MIFGADQQNKNLKEAAQKRIDTSPRTKTANAFSARIATSKSDGHEKNNMTNSSRSVLSESKSDPVRGSKEGLMDQVTVPIQMEGQGYDNEAIQKARYKKESVRPAARQDIANKLGNNSKKSGIINNYSSTFNKNSSANILSEHLKTDDMFR